MEELGVMTEVIRLFEESKAKLKKRLKKFDCNHFNFVFFADSWMCDGHASTWVFEEGMKKASEYEPLFILHGGDIVFSGNESNIDCCYNKIKSLDYVKDIPVFVTVGNHETDGVGGSTANFEEKIAPLHFTIDIPKLDFKLISLNNLNYELSDDELTYLKKELEHRQNNTFVVMHVPPKAGIWRNNDHTFTKGMEEFLRIVKGKVSRVLVSHIHAFAETKIDGARFVLSGGGGAQLDPGEINHIVVVNVNHGFISIKRIPI